MVHGILFIVVDHKIPHAQENFILFINSMVYVTKNVQICLNSNGFEYILLLR